MSLIVAFERISDLNDTDHSFKCDFKTKNDTARSMLIFFSCFNMNLPCTIDSNLYWLKSQCHDFPPPSPMFIKCLQWSSFPLRSEMYPFRVSNSNVKHQNFNFLTVFWLQSCWTLKMFKWKPSCDAFGIATCTVGIPLPTQLLVSVTCPRDHTARSNNTVQLAFSH